MSRNKAKAQTIKNASPDDIRPGDYVVWSEAWEVRGVALTDRREGTAHHRNEDGDWCAESGMWITGAEWTGSTITIRRPITEEG